MRSEPFAQDHPKLFVERDQSRVKGGIVEGGEAQPVAGVEAVVGEVAPGLDVAGAQQAGDVDAGDAAAHAVGGEDGLTEELLAAADLHAGDQLGRAGRNEERAAAFEPHFLAAEEIHFLILIVGEQVVEQLLAFEAERAGMIAELGPHLAVELRRARQPADAAGLLHRVERGEVAKLHRQTAWRAAHALGHINDDGIAFVELPKRQLAVEIERDREMLARPFHARGFGHEGESSRNRKSRKSATLDCDGSLVG